MTQINIYIFLTHWLKLNVWMIYLKWTVHLNTSSKTQERGHSRKIKVVCSATPPHVWKKILKNCTWAALQLLKLLYWHFTITTMYNKHKLTRLFFKIKSFWTHNMIPPLWSEGRLWGRMWQVVLRFTLKEPSRPWQSIMGINGSSAWPLPATPPSISITVIANNVSM